MRHKTNTVKTLLQNTHFTQYSTMRLTLVQYLKRNIQCIKTCLKTITPEIIVSTIDLAALLCIIPSLAVFDSWLTQCYFCLSYQYLFRRLAVIFFCHFWVKISLPVSVLTFSTPADLYLRFPPMQFGTCIFHSCIFHPCTGLD